MNNRDQLAAQSDHHFVNRGKEVSGMTSLASFPCNIEVHGQNPDERVLLFIRKHKVILYINLFFQTLLLTFPFLAIALLQWLNRIVFSDLINIDLEPFINSKYWIAVLVLWAANILRGYYNIFYKWYYDINILTSNRFIDLDLINIFKNRIEEASLLSIEDVKDVQPGLLQSLFSMGDLEVYTASGQTVFNLDSVPQSSKIRDFIMDAVVETKKKYN